MEYLMPKRLLVFLILILFLLAACSGAEQAAMSGDPAPEAQPQPTEVEPTEVEPTEVEPAQPEPTETAAPEAGSDVSSTGLQMECTLVSDQSDAPAEYAAIFGVKENDWVKGPETAAVTIVEYSDFQ
jgi:PBP1b-binding outer membrane lipoprotein LpoB